MLTFIGLLAWIILPGLAAAQLWRLGLPRSALIALAIGIVLILTGAGMQTLSAGPDHRSLLNLGFMYTAVSGASFISFGTNSSWQKLVFSFGFWAAHLGIGVLLALGFAGSLFPALTQAELPDWVGEIGRLQTFASALAVVGLLTMALLAILALTQAFARKTQTP